MSEPDYKKNDPKGWGGDPKRGAAMGRGPIGYDLLPTFEGTLYVKHVHLDHGGYDNNGTYWGAGDDIYWVADENDTIEFTMRASGAVDALAMAKASAPKAKVLLGADLPIMCSEKGCTEKSDDDHICGECCGWFCDKHWYGGDKDLCVGCWEKARESRRTARRKKQ